jgi:hypothetical protein
MAICPPWAPRPRAAANHGLQVCLYRERRMKDNSFSFFSQIIEVFHLIFTHPMVFVGFSAVSLLPYAATFFYNGTNDQVIFFVELACFVTFPASMGAAAKAVLDIQNKGAASFLNCLKAGFSKSAAFLVLIPVFLLYLIVMSAFAGLIVGILSFLFVSPVIVALVTLSASTIILAINFVSVPAIVLEHTSSLASLKRSAELTSGKILKITLFLYLLAVLSGSAVYYLLDGASGAYRIRMLPESLLEEFNFKLAAVYIMSATILFVACGVFYKTCFRLTESKKVEDLANIF